MPETRSGSMATAHPASRHKARRARSSSAAQLRSRKAAPALSPARRRRVRHQPANAALMKAPANQTEHPAPLDLAASSVVEPIVSPSQAGSTPAESVIEAGPELIGGISAGLESETSGLRPDQDLAGADSADSTMEDAADDLAEDSSDVANKENNLPDEALSNCGETSTPNYEMENAGDTAEHTTHPASKDTSSGAILSDVMENPPTGTSSELAAEELAMSSGVPNNGESDPSNDHHSSSENIPGCSQDPLEIEDSDGEDSDEAGVDSDYLKVLLTDHNLLDLLQETDSDSDSDSSGPSIAGQRRTLPYRESRYKARLLQQRENHVGSIIRLLQGLIEQIQSRNSGEDVGATGEGSLLDSEIGATGGTMEMIGFLQRRTAAYRKSLHHTRRMLKSEEED